MGGGGYSKKVGRYVLPRFSKVGSLELIFWLELEFWEHICAKVYISGAEI